MAKRALILAGGGLKVGFQAGVLQVWLDEAGLHVRSRGRRQRRGVQPGDVLPGPVRHARSPTTGASSTVSALALNWRAHWQLAQRPVAVHLDRFRRRSCRSGGIDWAKIRAGARAARSTSSTSRKKRLEVVAAAEMTEDKLIARGVAADVVPAGRDRRRHLHRRRLHHRRQRRGGHPPRRRRDLGDLDGQHRAASGATVSSRSTSRSSRRWPTATSAPSGSACESNNDAIAAGQPGEFGRHIEIKLLQAEVPLHYLINFTRDRMAEAVNSA